MTNPVVPAKHGAAFKQILEQEGKTSLFPRQVLEKYPHIVDQLYALWREPESLSKYFVELLTTQRENRAGFPLEIHSELFALESYYNASRPKAQRSDDYWTGVNQGE